MWYILWQKVSSHSLEMIQRYIFDFVFFQTPLHRAAENGNGDVVEILLLNGASINEKDVRNDRNEKWLRRWKDWETEWTIMKMGIWEADGLWMREERKREKICVFGGNGFDGF